MELFNIGFQELLFIAIIALLVMGPERLPEMLRRLGRLTTQARRISNELQRTLQEELGSLDEVRRDLNETIAPMREMRDELQGLTREVPRLITPPQIVARGGATVVEADEQEGAPAVADETPAEPEREVAVADETPPAATPAEEAAP